MFLNNFLFVNIASFLDVFFSGYFHTQKIKEINGYSQMIYPIWWILQIYIYFLRLYDDYDDRCDIFLLIVSYQRVQ